jgi:hypothetical protein
LSEDLITIKPVQSKLRDGWLDNVAASKTVLAQELAEASDWNAATLGDGSEWVW